MWMNVDIRCRSFSSLLSRTTCFKASCAGEPTFSHFVLRAVGEIGSCGQRLYRTDESPLCLSTKWCNMLVHFFEQLGVSFTRHCRPPRVICYRLNPRAQCLAFLFLGFRCQLGLDVFTKVPNVDLVLNSMIFL